VFLIENAFRAAQVWPRAEVMYGRPACRQGRHGFEAPDQS
jgi:hypothetical protein